MKLLEKVLEQPDRYAQKISISEDELELILAICRGDVRIKQAISTKAYTYSRLIGLYQKALVHLIAQGKIDHPYLKTVTKLK